MVSGSERRKQIVEYIKQSPTPLSGSALGKMLGVSRQVIVQDMALLRSEGHQITATARGYVMDAPNATRLFKVHHTNERTEEELTLITDLGGCVINVMVNHRAYGKMTAQLSIKNRRDVSRFIQDVQTGKSVPLLNVTSGYHFHLVGADSTEILDEIEQALMQKGFLCELLPYEKDI